MSLFRYVKGAVSNVHRPGDRPDIFIFATPRSGSTFLLELIAAQPGVKIYDDPVSINKPVARRELGIESWEQLTTMTDREERFQRYFDRLRQNSIKELNRPFYWQTGRFMTNRHVFKLLSAGEDMIGWFAASFDARIVILVRHPISTALSHQQLPRLPHYLRQPAFRQLFSGPEIAYAEEIIERGDFFEQGILDWALQMAGMFRPSPRPEWAVVSYEDLTVHSGPTYAYLCDKLWLDPLADLDALVARPSGSTDQSDLETQRFFADAQASRDRVYLIDKWTKRISDDQVRRAFEICKVFDIGLYEEGNLFPTAPYRVPGVDGGSSRATGLPT